MVPGKGWHLFKTHFMTRILVCPHLHYLAHHFMTHILVHLPCSLALYTASTLNFTLKIYADRIMTHNLIHLPCSLAFPPASTFSEAILPFQVIRLIFWSVLLYPPCSLALSQLSARQTYRSKACVDPSMKWDFENNNLNFCNDLLIKCIYIYLVAGSLESACTCL